VTRSSWNVWVCLAIIVGAGVILVVLNYYLRKLLVAAVVRYLPKYAKYFIKNKEVAEIKITRVAGLE